MTGKVTSVLKVVLSIGLAGALMYLVFRNINWEEFWKQAKLVNYTWVIASMGLSLIAYAARAYRWNILLEPLGYNLKTSRTLLAVLVGYLANLILPRLGEITRCGVLKRNDNVALPESFGSVVTERIVDMLTLLVLIFISLFSESDRLFTFLKTAYQDIHLPDHILVITLLLILAGVGLVLFVLIRKKHWKGKLVGLVKTFMLGLLSIRHIKRPLGFFVSTIILWAVYYFMSYIIVFSLPETAHLGFGAGFMLLITGGIALALPVQSGFGTYHGMIAGMLALYQVDQTTGVFLATLLHTSQIVSIALFGSIALIFSSLIQRKKMQKRHFDRI